MDTHQDQDSYGKDLNRLKEQIEKHGIDKKRDIEEQLHAVNVNTMKADRDLAEDHAGRLITENQDLREIVTFLWGCLDAIDSAEDAARGSSQVYKDIVRANHLRRWDTGITTDGYGLDIEAALRGRKAERERITNRELIRRFRAALAWCSGNAEFGREGKARDGWMKVCQSVMDETEDMFRPTDDSYIPMPPQRYRQQEGQ